MSVVDIEPGRVPSRAGIVMSEFNESITARLRDGAIEALTDLGVDEIVVARVPGALEVGVVSKGLIESGCDVVVAVGAVIKGETDHYEFVAGESSRALTDVALQTGRPVGNAVLTVREYEHAVDRSLPGPSNKGREAAEAAVAAFRVLAALGRV
jgi:6,7-dimethyl-8-ribityllumazine synthase